MITINVNSGIKVLHAIGAILPATPNNSNYVYVIQVNGGIVGVGDILVIEQRAHRISGTNGSIFIDFSIEALPSGFTNLVTLTSMTTSQFSTTSRHLIAVTANNQLSGNLITSPNSYFSATNPLTNYTVANMSNTFYIKLRLRNASTSDTSQFSHIFVYLIKKKV
ncbi:MAG: hypothetical protein ABIK73_08090 [candidate division WOR-3 bacterium]